MLSKDQIFSLDDSPRVEVEIPEWGGSVYVKTMSARERDRFEAEHLKAPTKDIRARLAVGCVCDVDGVLMFGPADVEILTNKSAKALDRIFSVALKLNGITSADVDELKKT